MPQPTLIHAAEALLPSGWAEGIGIAVGADGRIAAVGPAEGVPDVRVDLALPAPSNLHSHTFQRAMAGLTEARGPDPSDSFWTWRRLMYRFLDRLTPDDVEAIAAQAFVEMAEAGYAAVAEFHYLHHGPGGVPYANPAEMAERIAAAAARVGIGLTLLPVLYRWGGCDRRALEGGQRRFGCTPDGYADLVVRARALDLGPDGRVGVAPHSLRAVDPTALAGAVALGAGGPVHMHLAEQVAEVEQVEAAWGARPVAWLLDHAPVDAGWTLIHCTQMTAEETRALAGTGAVAGLCPITESNLGDGLFRGTEWRAAGGALGIGSDSDVQIALWDELRTLEYSQRLRDRSRAALAEPGRSTGRVLFEAAVAGGVQALGRDAGRLAPGAWADILGVSTDNVFVAGRRGDMALDSLLVSGRGDACLREVWSAGRRIVRDGRHPEREAVAAAYRAVLAGLEA